MLKNLRAWVSEIFDKEVVIDRSRIVQLKELEENKA